MPNFNATGPQGKGAKTGRGLGNCDSVQDQTTGTRPLLGQKRGRGIGRGIGRGVGRSMKRRQPTQ